MGVLLLAHYFGPCLLQQCVIRALFVKQSRAPTCLDPMLQHCHYGICPELLYGMDIVSQSGYAVVYWRLTPLSDGVWRSEHVLYHCDASCSESPEDLLEPQPPGALWGNEVCDVVYLFHALGCGNKATGNPVQPVEKAVIWHQ